MLWVRFNPDSFEIDSVTLKGITRKDKKQKLMAVIRNPGVHLGSDRLFGVLYLYYDSVTHTHYARENVIPWNQGNSPRALHGVTETTPARTTYSPRGFEPPHQA